MQRLLTLSLSLIIIVTAGFMQSAQAQQSSRVLDKIVAVVNDNIILKSEVDARTAEFLHNSRDAEFTDQLWYDVLESVIDGYVLYEQAKSDSIVVSSDEVNRAMDQRIRQLIAQVGSESELERALGQSLVQIRADYRDQFRREMMVERLRQKQMQRVRVTRPEVEEFYNEIPTDSLPMIPETVELAQIVVIPPPKQEARQVARQKAEALRDSLLNHGADFEELAKKHSDGPGASNGGLLPLMPLSDLVSEYAAAASALEPGEISGVVETRFGFHVIRLNRRVGDQIETNHILIQVGEEQIDEDYARDKLNALRDSVLTYEKDFRSLARRHSDDKATSPYGGRIINQQTNERRLAVNDLDPELYRTVIRLEENGEISNPVRFTTGERNNRKPAFRIVKLINRIPAHRANLEQDFDIIHNFARQQKQMEAMSRWLRELRDEVYVEYRIDSPYSASR